MDNLFEQMAKEMSDQVWFIWANLDNDDFGDLKREIPSIPHYRFFKQNKKIDHLDGAYEEVFKEKVEKHAEKNAKGEWVEEEKKSTSF